MVDWATRNISDNDTHTTDIWQIAGHSVFTHYPKQIFSPHLAVSYKPDRHTEKQKSIHTCCFYADTSDTREICTWIG